MSRNITIMFVPEKGNKRFTFTLSYASIKLSLYIAGFFACIAIFLCFDYTRLVLLRSHYHSLEKENQIIKSEAKLLTRNLETVKNSLTHVQEFARKVNDMVHVKMNTVKVKTGIGPLSDEDMESAKKDAKSNQLLDSSYPLGINVDKLIFSPVFSKIEETNRQSNASAIELEQLIASLISKKSLLACIPTVMPVRGLITSGFGRRASPFSGYLAEHRGIDIAAAVGTPIYAPADGVVTFVGNKADFGNMITIAHHKNGIVTKYAHNAENLVTVGQQITRGDHIASVGMTGNTTGPHVHYEVWVNDRPEDPTNFILDADIGLF